MDKEKTIDILTYFRDVDKRIRLNQQIIKNIEDQYYSSVGSMRMDGMPKGKGGITNTVERIALNIPKSVTRTIGELDQENKRLEEIKVEILLELNRLSYHKKMVILGFYIEGLQWERISARTNYSPRQCRNIRDNAIKQLMKNFSENKVITNYYFPEY